MAVDSGALIVPGHGTLFFADAETAVPANPLTAFSLTGTVPSGWENLGHTSTQNPAAFNIDGGDATSMGTWLADGVTTTYAPVTWSLTINDCQIDQNGLDLAFGGQFNTTGDGYLVPSSNAGVNKSLFLLATDGTGSLGFYIPNASVKLGAGPAIDPANFFELPLSATLNSSTTLPGINGVAGIFEVFKTGVSAS